MMVVIRLPSLGQRFYERIENCSADSAADTGDPFPIPQVGRLAQGTCHVTDEPARRNGDDFSRRCADRLDKEGDGSCCRVCVADGERYPLIAGLCAGQ